MTGPLISHSMISSCAITLEPLTIALAVLGSIVLLSIVQSLRVLFYQGSIQQRLDNLFTEE